MPISESWTSAVYSSDVAIDCGLFNLEWSYKLATDSTYVALDTSMFVADSTSMTISYSALTDQTKVGVYDLRYRVVMVDDTGVTSPYCTVPLTVTITDPCLSPVSLTDPGQPTVADYHYTLNSPSATLTTTDFVSDPSECTKTYTCATTSRPTGADASIDFCSFTDADGA